MTEARAGWGGKVLLSTDNTEANLTELAEVAECTFPQDETDEIDATHLQSPDGYEEIILGIKRRGEATATMNYVPGSATDLLLTAAFGDKSIRKIRWVIPAEDGSGDPDWNITTSVRVKRYGPDTLSPNEKITATAVFKATGAQEQGTGASGS